MVKIDRRNSEVLFQSGRGKVQEPLTQKEVQKESKEWRGGGSVVNYELVFAQKHKGQSVRQLYRCERRGLMQGQPTSWNTEINSRRGVF